MKVENAWLGELCIKSIIDELFLCLALHKINKNQCTRLSRVKLAIIIHSNYQKLINTYCLNQFKINSPVN